MAKPSPINPFEKQSPLYFSPEPARIPDYQLVRRIGVGSYGEVWLAQNIHGIYRAAKIVYRDNFQDERPFQREFAGIQKFEPISRTHESQVDILHVGRGPAYFYYLMELADDQETGQVIDPARYKPRTLRSELTRAGRLPFGECLRIGLALATALDHLHRHSLVHRDIKPSNIIFVNGIPKLADIGLVTSIDETRSFVGTEGFVAPEGAGTPQADIYSLGKTLYEMSTGLDRADFPELPTLMVEEAGSEQLLELNSVIARACRIHPAERYQTATELHADLSLLQSGRSVRKNQSLERKLKYLSRAAAVTVAIGGLLGTAYLFQRAQTAKAQKLAEENKILAERNRQQVVRLQTAAGSRFLSRGEPLTAALMYAEALKSSVPGSEEQKLQQLRLEWIIRETPVLEKVFPHHAAVHVARFSPDESLVLTASEDMTAQLWSTDTGEPMFGPFLHRERVITACFSPDGKWVATGTVDGSAQLWDVQTGKATGAPLKHRALIKILTFSPDGSQLLSASYDGTAKVWSVPKGEMMFAPLQHDGPIASAAYSPDGKQILTGGADKRGRLWSSETGQRLRGMKFPFDVDHVAFSPDAKRVLTGTMSGHPERAGFTVWDNESGKGIYSSSLFRGEGGGFIKFSPLDGRIIFGTSPLIISDPNTNKVLARLDHGPLRDIAFNADGTIAATGSERSGSAYIWNTTTGSNLFEPLKHGGYVNSVQFSANGKLLLTGSDDGAARIWNLDTTTGVSKTFLHSNAVLSVTVSSDGQQLLTTTSDGESHLWPRDRKEKIILPGGVNEANGSLFSNDGSKIVSGILRTTQTLFKGRSPGQPVFIWQRHPFGQEPIKIYPEGALTATALSSDDKYVATGTREGIAQVWDANTGLAVGRRLSIGSGVTCLVFAPDGKRVLVCNRFGEAKIWNWETGFPVMEELKHSFSIHAAAFSPDGKKIATAGLDQTARIWDAVTGKPLAEPFKHQGNLLEIAFSSDGRYLVTAGLAPFALVWDTSSGTQVLPAMEHSSAVYVAVFHPSRPILLTGSGDKTARLWSLIDGEPLTPPLLHEGRVTSGGFTPDGKSFFTGSLDGKVRLWNLPESSRSNEEYQKIVRLLSGYSYSATGALVSEKPHQLKELIETE